MVCGLSPLFGPVDDGSHALSYRLYSLNCFVPHLMAMNPGDVVILVVNVVEEHDRVAPLDMHR